VGCVQHLKAGTTWPAGIASIFNAPADSLFPLGEVGEVVIERERRRPCGLHLQRLRLRHDCGGGSDKRRCQQGSNGYSQKQAFHEPSPPFDDVTLAIAFLRFFLPR
jgi:hypothetical protein